MLADHLDEKDQKIVRRELLRAWALAQVLFHSPADIDGGPTCDERGCNICNGGLEAIEDFVMAATDGIDMGPDRPREYITEPDDSEIIDALANLSGFLGEL